MERIDGILCISYAELVKSEDNPMGVMSLAQYKKRYAELQKKERGGNGRTAMIIYDSLPLRYRQAWEALHGDPRDMNKQDKFANRLRPDIAARNKFTTYSYGDNQTLPTEVIEAYCNDAMILNTIRETIETKAEACAAIRHTMRGTWERMLELVNEIRDKFPNNIPKKVIPLKRKYEKYVAEGCLSLIHAGYGNKNRKIVKDEVCEAVLFDFIAHGSQLSFSKIAEEYNKTWAIPHEHPTITERTVQNYFTVNEFELGASRYGKAKWNDKYDIVIHRRRPPFALQLINTDDNDVDLYFKRKYIGKDGKLITDNYYRPKMYVVMDAYCDYPLGYAVGHTITKELIKEALRNALQHIKELTGNYHLWDVTVADRWGLNSDLNDFFKSVSLFEPPASGLARAKTIEPAFGNPLHNILKCLPNYAGHNITAKEKNNPEFAQANLKRRPDAQIAPTMIAQVIEEYRSQIVKRLGKSRKEAWIESFWKNEQSRKSYITPEVYLQKFGIPHNYQNTITNKGIIVTINEIKYTYDVPVNVYRQSVGKKVQVTYDPNDLTRVLVEGDKIRFIATENNPMPMSSVDYRKGDRAALIELWDAKKQLKQENENAKERRREINERMGTDAQSLLQAGVLIKGPYQQAVDIAKRQSVNDDMSFTDLI